MSISVDEFHEAHDRSEDYLRILRFYSPDKEHHKPGDWSWVLNLGNANFNGVGERIPDVSGGNLCMEVYHSKTLLSRKNMGSIEKRGMPFKLAVYLATIAGVISFL